MKKVALITGGGSGIGRMTALAFIDAGYRVMICGRHAEALQETIRQADIDGDLTFEQWRHTIDVNLNGAFLCANAAYNLMRRQTPQGGRIINNGSISAHMPRYGSASYTASKHAITGLTRSISLDGRCYNIACGQIDIGNAQSEMTAKMNTGVPQADGTLKSEPTIDVNLVAQAVVNMAALPLEANVQFMTIMATTMPYIGRG